jgi:hypothetical protein
MRVVSVAAIVLVGVMAIGALQVLAGANRTRTQLADERIALERLRLASEKLHRAARGVVRHDPDAMYAFANARRAFQIGIADARLRRAADEYEYTLQTATTRYSGGTEADAGGRLAAFETEIEAARAFDKQLDERAAQLRGEIEDARDRSRTFARYAQLLVLVGALAGIAATILARRRPSLPLIRREVIDPARIRRETLASLARDLRTPLDALGVAVTRGDVTAVAGASEAIREALDAALDAPPEPRLLR